MNIVSKFIPASLKSNPVYRGARSVWLFRQTDSYRRVHQMVRQDSSKIAAYLKTVKEPKLHLGCGENLLPGWLNTDFFPDNPAVVHLDLTEPFPITSASVDLVFSEHVIEHLPLAGGINMLREANRVLKPGGRIRISTPSLPTLLAIYAKPDVPDHRRYLDWHLETWLDGSAMKTPAIVLNDFVRNWGHLLIYDPETLLAMFKEAGFEQVSECKLQRSADDRLTGLENETRMPERLLALHTMTFEAVKP